MNPHQIPLVDFEPDTGDVLRDVIDGLSQTPKRLPAKLFYDERGSRLFDRICELDEYYVTRTELDILRSHARDIASHIGPHALLMEFGSGSSEKTRILLDTLEDIAAYVPIDISREHLLASAHLLARDYPSLTIRPVCADYEATFEIPSTGLAVKKRVVYFPGSTVGNFHPQDAAGFLRRMNHLARGADDQESGGLLIGVDLIKDETLLLSAYDDPSGVTAAFNLNVLERINREAGAQFDISAFRHVALFNPKARRVEMHLESLRPQTVEISGQAFHFEAGERVWTESSYKYTVEGFSELAAAAGFGPGHLWTDANRHFAVLYFPATA